MVKMKYIELIQNLNDSDSDGPIYLGLADAGGVQNDPEMIQVEQMHCTILISVLIHNHT